MDKMDANSHLILNRTSRRELEEGITVITSGQGGSSLGFAPPLVMQEEEIDEAIRILDECIAEEERDMGLQ